MKLRLLILLLLIPFLCKAQAPNFCLSKVSHATVNLSNQHDLTFRQLDINASSTDGIHLVKCHDIHITKLNIHGINTTTGIIIDNCFNVTIDTVSVDNLAQGISIINCNYANNNIKVDYNQSWNISDPFINTTGRGHFLQFSHCNGAGMEAIGNSVDNPVGANLLGVGDEISAYMSFGTTASPLKIWSSRLRNGGSGLGPKQQSSGITIGDGGGGNTDVRFNILVSTGFAGIIVAGGQNQTVIGNTIYSPSLPYSSAGLTSANFASAPASSTITQNIINWFGGIPNINHQRDTVYKPSKNTLPIGWKSNTVKAPINGSVLPVTIFQTCNGLVFPPIAPITYGAADFFLVASSSNPISYTSSNTAVATIVGGNKLHVAGAGSTTVAASDGLTTVPQVAVIGKAQLNIFADFKTKTQGIPNPTLTATIAGFKYADNTSVFLTSLVLSTTAVTGSPNGTYPIVAGGASASNYNISFFNNFLVIGAVIQTGLTVAQPHTVIFQGH